MKDRGTAADPTLIPYHIIFSLSGGYFGTTSRRFTFSDSANRAVVRRMKEAGIPLGIGTDLVVDWYRYLPWPISRNFARLPPWASPPGRC
ncbi:MAG: hypothetical protein R2882_06185 [Gemmatimonadales bacterium]